MAAAQIRTIRAETRVGLVGFCIYCGSKENLSDEHIVPLALGGNAILAKARTWPANPAMARHFGAAAVGLFEKSWGPYS